MDLRKILKKLYPIRDVIFPPLCLHCQEKASSFICSDCQEHVVCCESSFFCGYCSQPFCKCQEEKVPSYGAVLFPSFGPAVTLCKEMKKGNLPGLVKLIASFLVFRADQLSFPIPDRIVRVPSLEKAAFPYDKELAFELSHFYEKRVILPIGVKKKVFFEPNWKVKKKKVEGKNLFFCVNTKREILIISKLLESLHPKAMFGISLQD